jgi:hypothetical protein
MQQVPCHQLILYRPGRICAVHVAIGEEFEAAQAGPLATSQFLRGASHSRQRGLRCMVRTKSCCGASGLANFWDK